MSPIELAGEQFLPLPERALWWPRKRALLVADLHLGKDASLSACGVEIPEGSDPATLARLSALCDQWQPEWLLLLGDLVHDHAARRASVTEAPFPGPADRVLIMGNHDRYAGSLPSHWGIATCEEPHCLEGIELFHIPPAASKKRNRPFIAGHIHPAVRVHGPGRQTLRLPAFVASTQRILLPAFGELTGCAEVRPGRGDRVILCTNTGLHEMKRL